MSSKFSEVVPKGGRGKKRKLADAKNAKQLPTQKVVTKLPASAIYTQLCEFEKKVDATLARKKAEVNEAIKRVERTPRTVRLYVYNTFKPASKAIVTGVAAESSGDVNRGGAGASAGGGGGKGGGGAGGPNDATTTSVVEDVEPASWTLHIQGRVLAPHETADGKGDHDPDAEPKFSTFVRTLEVKLDPTLYPDSVHRAEGAEGAAGGGGEGPSSVIRWEADKAPAGSTPIDGFEIKRQGDRDTRVKIILRVDHQPERYKLSAELSSLLGMDLETRPRIISALWQYVKLHNLLDADDATTVVLDTRLKACFADDAAKLKFVDMAQRLHAQLTPAPPIEIDYVVRTYGRKNPTVPDCYDILVDVPTPATAGHHQFIERLNRDRDVEACDARIAAAAKKIGEHVRRRTFFLGFSHSPVDFINTIVATQARDMAVVRGDGEKRREAERRTELYMQPWVDEAVMRYISRKTNAGQ